MRRVICLAEDRYSDECVLRLAVQSIVRSEPDYLLIVFGPNVSADFLSWAARFSSVQVRQTWFEGASGWNTKPHVLLQLLREGFEEIWWIDSDIIVAKSFTKRFSAVGLETFLVCEEALSGAYDDFGHRCVEWHLELVRHFNFALNSCVMRISPLHISLIESWRELLSSPEYLASQRGHWLERPVHMLSDQDVLTALLCSSRYCDVQVQVIRRGRDIIQYFGTAAFTLAERLRTLVRGLPPFVHSQGYKPWRSPAPTADGLPLHRRVFLFLLSDTSPYLVLARRFRTATGLQLSWTRPQTTAGRLLILLGMGSVALTGMPVSALADILRQVGIGRRSGLIAGKIIPRNLPEAKQ